MDHSFQKRTVTGLGWRHPEVRFLEHSQVFTANSFRVPLFWALRGRDLSGLSALSALSLLLLLLLLLLYYPTTIFSTSFPYFPRLKSGQDPVAEQTMSLSGVCVSKRVFLCMDNGVALGFPWWEKVSQGIPNLWITVSSISLWTSVAFDSILACYVFLQLRYFWRLGSVCLGVFTA